MMPRMRVERSREASGADRVDPASAQTRIVLIDGQNTIEYARVKHTGANVYLFHGGDDDHISYHRSGQFHQKRRGEIAWKTRVKPLAEFQGTFHFVTSSLTGTNLANWGAEVRQFEREPANVVAIDVRAVPHGSHLHIGFGLVEPGRLELVSWMLPAFECVGIHTSQLVFVTSVTPWVYVWIGTGILQAPDEANETPNKPPHGGNWRTAVLSFLRRLVPSTDLT